MFGCWSVSRGGILVGGRWWVDAQSTLRKIVVPLPTITELATHYSTCATSYPLAHWLSLGQSRPLLGVIWPLKHEDFLHIFLAIYGQMWAGLTIDHGAGDQSNSNFFSVWGGGSRQPGGTPRGVPDAGSLNQRSRNAVPAAWTVISYLPPTCQCDCGGDSGEPAASHVALADGDADNSLLQNVSDGLYRADGGQYR